MKNDEQNLFDYIEDIGETLEGKIHIVDQTGRFSEPGEAHYRVYHADGYCFESKKEIEPDETETLLVTYYYSFFEIWDEFKKIGTAKAALVLIKRGQ